MGIRITVLVQASIPTREQETCRFALALGIWDHLLDLNGSLGIWNHLLDLNNYGSSWCLVLVQRGEPRAHTRTITLVRIKSPRPRAMVYSIKFKIKMIFITVY